jgi:adenylate cyclase class 2
MLAATQLWQHFAYEPHPISSSAQLYSAVASRRTPLEIEIKLRVADIPQLLRRLRRLRAVSRGRFFEQNTLYDTPAFDIRRSGCLLRLRTETAAPAGKSARGHVRGILTAKAPPSVSRGSRYKERLERERKIRNPRRWNAILRGLGLRPGFRYEKYRSTFRLPGLHLDLDETPAGVFLELEGSPSAIDRAAKALGYAPHDFVRATYWDIYAADCRRRGCTPRNMVFRT